MDNVYYQPPENLKMKYPCIRYEKEDIDTDYADDRVYSMKDQYTITIIGLDPDTDVPRIILDTFQYCNFDRRYISDNLYHDVLTIYY